MTIDIVTLRCTGSMNGQVPCYCLSPSLLLQITTDATTVTSDTDRDSHRSGVNKDTFSLICAAMYFGQIVLIRRCSFLSQQYMCGEPIPNKPHSNSTITLGGPIPNKPNSNSTIKKHDTYLK